MIKCNTQANDMATMAINWQTSGASDPGRYNTPPLTRDLIQPICNTPDVTSHICNSNSCHFWLCVMIFPSWSGFVFRFAFCFVMHLISCHHVHLICLRVRLMHPSIFPVVRFAIRHSHLLRRTPLVSFREWVLNVLGMDRGLPSGLGIPPVDHLSSFVPFGGRLMLQRLTG